LGSVGGQGEGAGAGATLICLSSDEECLTLLLPSINLLSSSLLVVDALYDVAITHLLHDTPIGTAVRSSKHKQFRLRKDEVFNKQRLPRARGSA